MKHSTFYAHLLDAVKQNSISIDEALLEAKKIGYDGLEIDYNNIKDDPDGFRAMLDRAGLVAAAVYYFNDFAHGTDWEKVEEGFKNINTVGAKYCLIIPGFINPEDDREEALKLMIEGENRCVEIAKKYGISITMEDFDFYLSPISNIEGIEYFLNNVPGLSHALDTGNYYYSDDDVLEAFEKFKDRITYVHLKDRSLTELNPGEMDKESVSGVKLYSCPVGEGVIPLKEVMHRLKAMGYDGWLATEQFASKNQIEYLKRSMNNIKKLWAEA